MTERTWIIESIRGTFFTVSNAPLKLREWWTKVAGLEYPALQVTEGPIGQGVAQAQIEAGTAYLALVCQPGRMDWHYAFGTEPSTLSLMGGTPAIPILHAFVDRLSRWIHDAPQCNRVALGTSCRVAVSSRKEGYEHLKDLLPAVQIDADGSRDFLYRVNRPRQSKSLTPALEINRLGEWAVVHLTLTPMALQANAMAFQAGPLVSPFSDSQAAIVQMTSALSSAHFVKVAFDMNTSGDASRIFSTDDLSKVTKELVELTIESMHEGDRP